MPIPLRTGLHLTSLRDVEDLDVVSAVVFRGVRGGSNMLQVIVIK
jgi:hypothetical protein